MVEEKTIEKYVTNFTRHFSKYLRPGLGINSIVYPTQDTGAIILFALVKSIKNQVQYKTRQATINQTIKKVNPKAFGGNPDLYRYRGTNINMHHNKIIIIKSEDDPNEWNLESAKRDVERIISHKSGK